MSLVSPPRSCLWLCAFALALAACADVVPEPEPHCQSGKCDDPVGELTPHALAVLACDQSHGEALALSTASLAERLASENDYLECLAKVDDGAVVSIEDNLVRPERARSINEIFAVFDEYRYASLCSDIGAASLLPADQLALSLAQCQVLRERALAQAIGALVDFAGERTAWQLESERSSFADCYRDFDARVATGLSPVQVYAAQQDLVACSAENLYEHARLLKDAQCRLSACSDESLLLLFIEAGFETAIVTSDRVCDLLVDASIYREVGDPTHVMECEIAFYAQLKSAVVAGLSDT